MEFPKAFLLVTFYLFALVTANLNDDKKAAINKLDTQFNNIKKFVEKTSAEVDKKEESFNLITEFIVGTGEKMTTNTRAEISRTSSSLIVFANLKYCPSAVLECLDRREEQYIVDLLAYYNNDFLKAVRDEESKAYYQTNLINIWKDGFNEYADIYKKSVSDIEKATNGATISSIVKNFENTTTQVADFINSIVSKMTRTQIQLLRALEKIIDDYQERLINYMEEASQALNRCFNKSYLKEILFGSKLF